MYPPKTLRRVTVSQYYSGTRSPRDMLRTQSRIQNSRRLALVACQGIITLHNDSVRKYAKDEYMHGSKQRQAKQAVAKRGRTPPKARKRHAKQASSKCGNRTDDSESEDSAPAASSAAGKQRGKRTDRAQGDCSGSSARGKSRTKTKEYDDGDGAGRRQVLPAGSRTGAAKYVSILASNMFDNSKTDVIETMLLAETDCSLKSFIQDHLEDMGSLEQLACNLQEGEGDTGMVPRIPPRYYQYFMITLILRTLTIRMSSLKLMYLMHLILLIVPLP